MLRIILKRVGQRKKLFLHIIVCVYTKTNKWVFKDRIGFINKIFKKRFMGLDISKLSFWLFKGARFGLSLVKYLSFYTRMHKLEWKSYSNVFKKYATDLFKVRLSRSWFWQWMLYKKKRVKHINRSRHFYGRLNESEANPDYYKGPITYWFYKKMRLPVSTFRGDHSKTGLRVWNEYFYSKVLSNLKDAEFFRKKRIRRSRLEKLNLRRVKHYFKILYKRRASDSLGYMWALNNSYLQAKWKSKTAKIKKQWMFKQFPEIVKPKGVWLDKGSSYLWTNFWRIRYFVSKWQNKSFKQQVKLNRSQFAFDDFFKFMKKKLKLKMQLWWVLNESMEITEEDQEKFPDFFSLSKSERKAKFLATKRVTNWMNRFFIFKYLFSRFLDKREMSIMNRTEFKKFSSISDLQNKRYNSFQRFLKVNKVPWVFNLKAHKREVFSNYRDNHNKYLAKVRGAFGRYIKLMQSYVKPLSPIKRFIFGSKSRVSFFSDLNLNSLYIWLKNRRILLHQFFFFSLSDNGGFQQSDFFNYFERFFSIRNCLSGVDQFDFRTLSLIRNFANICNFKDEANSSNYVILFDKLMPFYFNFLSRLDFKGDLGVFLKSYGLDFVSRMYSFFNLIKSKEVKSNASLLNLDRIRHEKKSAFKSMSLRKYYYTSRKYNVLNLVFLKKFFWLYEFRWIRVSNYSYNFFESLLNFFYGFKYVLVSLIFSSEIVVNCLRLRSNAFKVFYFKLYSSLLSLLKSQHFMLVNDCDFFIKFFWRCLFRKFKFFNINYFFKKIINIKKFKFSKKTFFNYYFNRLLLVSDFWKKFSIEQANRFLEVSVNKLELILNFFDYLIYRLKLLVYLLLKLSISDEFVNFLVSFIKFVENFGFETFSIDSRLFANLNNIFLNIQLLLADVENLVDLNVKYSVRVNTSSHFNLFFGEPLYFLGDNIKGANYNDRRLVVSGQNKLFKGLFSSRSAYYHRPLQFFDNNVIYDMLKTTVSATVARFFKKNLYAKKAIAKFKDIYSLFNKNAFDVWWFANSFFRHLSLKLAHKLLWRKLISKWRRESVWNTFGLYDDINYGKAIVKQRDATIYAPYVDWDSGDESSVEKALTVLNFVPIIKGAYIANESKIRYLKALSYYYYIWFYVWKKLKVSFFNFTFFRDVSFFLNISFKCFSYFNININNLNLYIDEAKVCNVFLGFDEVQSDVRSFINKFDHLPEYFKLLNGRNNYNLTADTSNVVNRLDSFVWNFMLNSINSFFRHRSNFHVVKRVLFNLIDKKRVLRFFLSKSKRNYFGKFFKLQAFSLYSLMKHMRANDNVREKLFVFITMFRLKYLEHGFSSDWLSERRSVERNVDPTVSIGWRKPLFAFRYLDILK